MCACLVCPQNLLLFHISCSPLIFYKMGLSAMRQSNKKIEFLWRIILDSFMVTCSQCFTYTCHLFVSQLWSCLYMYFLLYLPEVMILVHISHAVNSLSVPLTFQLLFCSLSWLFCISKMYNCHARIDSMYLIFWYIIFNSQITAMARYYFSQFIALEDLLRKNKTKQKTMEYKCSIYFNN